MPRIVEDGHLGGFYDEGDMDTLAPDVWEYLIEKYKLTSMLDIGCGPGKALDYFQSKKILCLGIDGSTKSKQYAKNPNKIEIHDYTKGPFNFNNAGFDFGWSCEFVEHVEEKYIQNFLSSFQRCKYIAFTHAVPGQHGWHHVNCQPEAYWIERVTAAGFRVDLGESKHLRGLLVGKVYGRWVRDTLLFAVNEKK